MQTSMFIEIACLVIIVCLMVKRPEWKTRSLALAGGITVYLMAAGLNGISTSHERQATAAERQAEAAEQSVKLIREQNEAWTELKGLLAHIPTPLPEANASAKK